MGGELVLALGRPKGKADDESSDEMESEDSVSQEEIDAGTDFASAVKSGDGEAIALAYKAMAKACGY